METKMDMLHGPILKKILIFAFPIILGSVLQQLFSAVDIAVVGLTGDSNGQAAIGANTSLIALFVNFFVGLTVGINVVIGNYIGQGHKERISSTVHTAIMFAAFSGVGLLLLVEMIARPMLVIMATPKEVLGQAVTYLRIYAMGMPFILLYNFGAAVLRTVGDTKRPLYALLAAGFINMVLDLVLTAGLKLGVVGVAVATAFSNVISSALVIYFLVHEDGDIRLNIKKLAVSGDDLEKLLKIGLPSGFQTMVFSIANICIQATINSYGPAAVAGNAVALIFEVLAYYVVTGINQAAVTFTSVNYGACDLKRCLKVFGISMAVAVVLTNIVNISFILGEKFFVGLFTSDVAVAECVYLRFKIVLAVQFLICSYEISGSVLRGFGRSMLPAVITIFGTCVLRIIWVNTVCARVRDISYVFVVYPVSWIVTGIAVVAAFIVTYKKLLSERLGNRA